MKNEDFLRKNRTVPGTGFEPAHLAAPPPEDGASTNFATRATGCKYSGVTVNYKIMGDDF